MLDPNVITSIEEVNKHWCASQKVLANLLLWQSSSSVLSENTALELMDLEKSFVALISC